MNRVLLFEALIGPALVAWLFLRPACTDRSTAATLESAGVSIGFGLGATSSAFFLWRLIGLPLGVYPAFEIGLQVIAAAAGVFAWRSRRASRVAGQALLMSAPRMLALGAGGVAFAGLAAGAAMFWQASASLPYGEWDGWAIWNLRASFLVVPTDAWRAMSSPVIQWSHPDYPLLVSASVARLWTFGDAASVAGPRLLAGAVVVASVLVVAGSVWRRTGLVGVALAVSLLLVPSYLYWGASQTADVPLGLYSLTAVAALAAPHGEHRYPVAGLAAGFGAWTKNEGMLLVAAVILIAAALAARSRSWRPLVHALLGAAAGLFALLVFKLTVGPASDLLRQIVSQDPVGKALTAERHLFVGGYMLREMFTWGGWSPIPAFVLVAASLAAAAARWRRVPRDVAIGGTVAVLMLAAFYAIYVLSPYDVEWHLRTSFPRLIAQVWPLIVWTTVMATRTPERAR